jgi:hypothetical protein
MMLLFLAPQPQITRVCDPRLALALAPPSATGLKHTCELATPMNMCELLRVGRVGLQRRGPGGGGTEAAPSYSWISTRRKALV